jgi:hypothetical protein
MAAWKAGCLHSGLVLRADILVRKNGGMARNPSAAQDRLFALKVAFITNKAHEDKVSALSRVIQVVALAPALP